MQLQGFNRIFFWPDDESQVHSMNMKLYLPFIECIYIFGIYLLLCNDEVPSLYCMGLASLIKTLKVAVGENINIYVATPALTR